jgi:hypothetical protein
VDKVFDGVFRLVNSIDLLLGIVLMLRFWLVGVWDRLKPDVDDAHSERDREVKHED